MVAKIFMAYRHFSIVLIGGVNPYWSRIHQRSFKRPTIWSSPGEKDVLHDFQVFNFSVMICAKICAKRNELRQDHWLS